MDNVTQTYAIHVIRSLLPAGAELEILDYPAPHPAVLAADLDGDGVPEIVGGYRADGKMHAMIVKYAYDRWFVAAQFRGPGYAIANLLAAPIVDPRRNTLLVGWQIGAVWAQLDLWQGEPGGYRHLTPRDVFYSKLEVKDMSGPRGPDGLCEIALWVHDAEDAYKIDLWRWQGGLMKDIEAYPYYYRTKVVPYYERLLRGSPDSDVYRRYLREAEAIAGRGSADRKDWTTPYAGVLPVAPETRRDERLEAAIGGAFGLEPGDEARYLYNRVDLNGDGIPETIAYVAGKATCGTGGCGAVVFGESDSGYRQLGKLTLVRAPIVVSPRATNGFRDLLLRVEGGGVPRPFLVALKFNGVNYPSNPSTQLPLPDSFFVEGDALFAGSVSEKGIPWQAPDTGTDR